MYSIIGICIAGGLIALGVIAILISGVRGILTGNTDFKKIGMFIVPFVVYGIAYLLTDDFARAGIATSLFMMATMALGIFVTGFRSTFNF